VLILAVAIRWYFANLLTVVLTRDVGGDGSGVA
jgi:hypothetical protein